MNRSYRSLIVFCFILMEILYVLSLMANIATAPAWVQNNGEMILMASVVFNMLILGTLIF